MASQVSFPAIMGVLGRWAVRRPFTSIALVLVVGIGVAHLGDFITYSDGSAAGRQGRVTKFSHKGILFCSSWEGQLAMEGFQRGNGQGGASNVFEFTVEDPVVREQIIEAYNSNALVSLGYNQTFTHWSCRRATDYLIVKVTVLKSDKAGAVPGPAP